LSCYPHEIARQLPSGGFLISLNGSGIWNQDDEIAESGSILCNLQQLHWLVDYIRLDIDGRSGWQVLRAAQDPLRELSLWAAKTP
jgi:hypothetical protein